MSNWQPIETAPKDGTPILLAVEGKIAVAYWFSQFEWSKLKFKRVWQALWADGQFEDGAQPAHWMPLPSPPHLEDRQSTEGSSGSMTVNSPK